LKDISRIFENGVFSEQPLNLAGTKDTPLHKEISTSENLI